MTTPDWLETAARTEAERRYPRDTWGLLGFDDARSVSAFIAGAKWTLDSPEEPVA